VRPARPLFLLGLAGASVVLLSVLALVVMAASVWPVGYPSPSSPGTPEPGHPPPALVALDSFVAASLRCGISASLLLAQQQLESGFDPTAVSPAGAEGLAQFEPATFARYAEPVPLGGMSPPSPFDPVDSAFAEARMLCANKAGRDLTRALVVYNCGSASLRCYEASLAYAVEVEDLARRIQASI
jgi:hypothetical protein